MQADQSQRTDAQRQASRLNGAKSNGPVTQEGKAASSQNARKHGFSSPKFLYDTEDEQAFAELLADYRASYAPADRAEEDLVQDMAIARFRLDSVRAARAAATDLEAARQEPILDQTVANADDEALAAQVLLVQARNGDADKFTRYEAHFDRLFHRALRALLALQQHRSKRQKSPSQAEKPVLQNEPKVQPRLVSINEAIALGYIPSLRPEREEHLEITPNPVPDDAAA